MDQEQIILYVRGVTDATDLANAQAVLSQTDGIVKVAHQHIPPQDGSEALATQLLVTYQPDLVTPSFMVSQLVDSGFAVVLQEVVGTEEAEVNPLKDLKTTAPVTHDFHVEHENEALLPQTQDIVLEPPARSLGTGGPDDVTHPASPLGEGF